MYFLIFLARYAKIMHTLHGIWPKIINSFSYIDLQDNNQTILICMKKKNQKRNDALKLRSAIETLSFQTNWGLRKLGGEDSEKYGELSKAEVGYITELGLVQDILAIKDLVDGIRKEFQVEPCLELGDFCKTERLCGERKIGF